MLTGAGVNSGGGGEAADPFAAAEWFDTYCKSNIEFLFGGGKGQARGLFGTCEAYGAVKECYGRGSLHGHYLLWTSEITLLQTLIPVPVPRRDTPADVQPWSLLRGVSVCTWCCTNVREAHDDGNAPPTRF